MKFIFLLFVSLILFSESLAQTGTIRGRLIDSKTLEPLPFANVFINNTTIGTTTDTNGNFVLKNVTRPSSFDLIMSFVGYQSFSQKISLTEPELDIHTIKLIPLGIELASVEVTEKKDVEWEKNLKKFKKIFLGEEKEAELCTITNPWVLEFARDNQKRFVAVASVPLQIENKALGYKVHFYLSRFAASGTEYLIGGNVRFEKLAPSNDSELLLWESNRRKSYLHSRQHLFKAIVNKRIKGEGFDLYTDIAGPELTMTRSAFFKSELGHSVKVRDTTDLIAAAPQKGIFKIVMKDRVEVHYNKEKVRMRTYRDVFFPVSWISLNKGYVFVNKEGVELNPSDVITSGDMNKDRVAQMLPLDYSPELTDQINEETKNSMMTELYEKIYVHTDKPYYYSGEPIWFKGYLNYSSPLLRDSLSQTAYVELIDREKKKIILSKTLKIDSGIFRGDFILPDSLRPATYYLRAYTTWNRNFGSDIFFIQPLPVLDLMDKVDPQIANSSLNSDSTIFIKPDKLKYKTREKITLSVKLVDEEGHPVASNLSLAVTDASQVIPVKPFRTIHEGMLMKVPESLPTPSYPVEYGFTFSGRFLNAENKSEKAMLSVIRLKPNNFYMSQSDEEGKFSVSGLSFYDSATFSIQAMNEKGGAAYGKAELIKEESPDINFNKADYELTLLKANSKQRIISQYEVPRDAYVFEAVEVRSSRIREEYQADYKIKRPYGKPDYVLKAKDINTKYGNLLLAIQGRFPGLNVRQALKDGEEPRWVVYSQRQLSIGTPKEVLVTVNDVVTTGTPDQILSAIDPNTVETIELKNGVNVLYGHLGGNGILAIYLKKEIADQEKAQKNVPIVKVQGYATPRIFKFPDYSKPATDPSGDYRSLLYWNPDVTTNDGTGSAIVSFYASDVSGAYHIVAEGITKSGKPVRGESFVKIE